MKQDDKVAQQTVEASSVPEGEVFRKPGGTYRYLRLAVVEGNWSGKQLDASKVWAACLENGNLTFVEPQTKVVRLNVVFGVGGV